MIDPFRLCVAVVPLAVYCLMLGAVNLSRRPRLTTGTRDLALLGAALTGLMVIGPMELFMPMGAVATLGRFIWPMLLAFYGLSVSLLVLLARPRLVVYNSTIDELRPILSEVTSRLDDASRWAGDSLAMPRAGLSLYLDAFPAMRNVSLVASGGHQRLETWRSLETALRTALRTTRTQVNPRGVSLVTMAILLLATCAIRCWGDPQALAQGIDQMLLR